MEVFSEVNIGSSQWSPKIQGMGMSKWNNILSNINFQKILMIKHKQM